MARKAVLNGGKRDEIIEVAKRLFLQNGYEGTSVRMVLDEVGGEVGMFYHYFPSKKELFDQVLEKFMKDQSERFSALANQSSSMAPRKILEQLVDNYFEGVSVFKELTNGVVHWSVLSALHTMTVASMMPSFRLFITQLLNAAGETTTVAVEHIATFSLVGVGGLLRDDGFLQMDKEQQYVLLIELLCRMLQIPVSIFADDGNKVEGK